MSGFAEELAADLADLDDEEYDYEEEATVTGASSAGNWPPNGATKRSQGAEGDEEMSDAEAEAEVTAGPTALDAMGVMAGGVRPAEQLDAEAVERMELSTVEDVSKVAKLYGSKRMRDIVHVRQGQG